jgi:hypothetical protein
MIHFDIFLCNFYQHKDKSCHCKLILCARNNFSANYFRRFVLGDGWKLNFVHSVHEIC